MFSLKKSNDLTGYIFIIFTVIIWGSTWPLGRWMVSEQYGPTIPPFMIATLRYIIVVLCFLPLVYYLDKKNIDFAFFKKHWKELSIMGLLSVTIYQFGYLYGEKYTAGGDAALMVGIAPVLILFISSILINEKLTRIKALGGAIAFGGVLLIVGFSPNVQIPLQDRLFGDALVFFGVCGYATYTVMLKRLFNKYDPANRPTSIQILFWVSLVGLIGLYPITLLLYPEYLSLSSYLVIHERIWFGIFYLAILSTVFAYVTYTEAVRILGASRSGIFVNLVPVVGVATSVFIGEVFDIVTHTASFILIFIGISLVNKKEKPMDNVDVDTESSTIDTPTKQLESVNSD